jgi:hypothetical protein
MAAIRTAASERKLEEDLARERKAALTALAAAAADASGGAGAGAPPEPWAGGPAGGAGACTAIGEALARSEFRRELLRESAPEGRRSSDAGGGDGVLSALRALSGTPGSAGKGCAGRRAAWVGCAGQGRQSAVPGSCCAVRGGAPRLTRPRPPLPAAAGGPRR